MEIILLLADDPVPNIRFNIAKTVQEFYSKLTPGSKIKTESAIQKLCNDSDFDVSHFAKRCMDHINKLNRA